MQDPFPIQPIPWLQRAIQPVADFFGFASLPLHIHEVLAGCLLYGIIYYPLSPVLSSIFFPSVYPQLPRRRKVNWHAHVVSLVQSCLINAVALWVMFADDERKNMTWEERIWGYTGPCGMVQGLAAGYFLWDLIVTSRNMDVFGMGTLAHAVSALAVYSLGFRPFANYYGSNFILWELSTPFLNIHWFLDKLDMTGSSLQLYNGLALISTFFSCRLVYGTYQSFLIFKDIWHAIGNSPGLLHLAAEDTQTGTMRFVTESTTVPTWLAGAYLASNITLNSLNSFWFFKMIQALYKRFQPPTEASVRDETTLGKSTALDPSLSSSVKSRPGGGVNGEPELDIVI